MKRMIAYTLVAALMLGVFVSPAQAASPAFANTQVTEGNRPPPRPNGNGHTRPDFRPPHQQPGRPSAPQPGHRPPAHQPNYRPDHRPGGHHSSSSSNFGWGMLIGAVVGSAITHATHR